MAILPKHGIRYNSRSPGDVILSKKVRRLEPYRRSGEHGLVYQVDIQQIIEKMSLDDKVSFVSGADFWRTEALPLYEVPPLHVSDGPHGLRKQEGSGAVDDHLGLHSSLESTCFPTASAIGSTWDVDLAREMGFAIGQEACNAAVDVILGPGVNMKRNPLCGRNFEYYSEDPFLSGKIAAAWIDGVQENGVGVAVKHFAANNQESKRMSSDSLVDERALREYYLPAFEIAVGEANPTMVMTAYNKLNGTYCSDNRTLLTEILREEWGFSGAVVSDWGGTNDRVAGIDAGMDLEMPGSRGFFDASVKNAVSSGKVSPEKLDDAVRNVLGVIERTALAQHPIVPDDVLDRNHTLARRIAAASGVLLKNENGILPLDPGKPVAVVGAMAKAPRYQGCGSSLVNPHTLDSLLDGFSDAGVTFTYQAGYRTDDVSDAALIHEAVQAVAECETAICCIGLTDIHESESFDRSTLGLPANQLDMLEAVCTACDRVVVVLACGSAIEMPWIESVRAVLHMHLGGQAVGSATADLLLGIQNPCGRLSETYPAHYEDVVSSPYYLKQPKQAAYLESMYCGYRYFDSAGKDVLFPFGFGLSYTDFSYDSLVVEQKASHDFNVHFTVRNIGDRTGAEISQLYIAPKTGGVFRPEHELKGFAKIILMPNEEQRISLSLNKRSFAHFDTEAHAWVVESGEYEVLIGASSRDIRLAATIKVAGCTPKRSPCSPWYYRLEGMPKKADFTTLYGPYPDYIEQTKGTYDQSSSIKEMSQTSALCRVIFRIIEWVVGRTTCGRIDYNNVQFKIMVDSAGDNPVKNLPLYSSGGLLSPRLMQLVVDVANGSVIAGIMRYFEKKERR